jgi:hypothetical protein
MYMLVLRNLVDLIGQYYEYVNPNPIATYCTVRSTVDITAVIYLFPFPVIILLPVSQWRSCDSSTVGLFPEID